jgi:hypothetical protein
MRPLVVSTAVVIAATLVGTEDWFGDSVGLALVLCLAGAVAAFNWWEVWSTRDRR